MKRNRIFKFSIRKIIIAFVLFLLCSCLSILLLFQSFYEKMQYLPNNIDSRIVYQTENGQISSSLNSSLSEEEKEAQKYIESNSTSLIQSKDVLNILLVGTDNRQNAAKGRSDSMMIMSINKKTNKIIVTSLMRDIYLDIPGYGGNRLNVATAFGGPNLLIETIQNNFKIKIDRYVAVDFFSFVDIVNKLGGVTLQITDEEIPVINSYVRELNHLRNMPENDSLLTHAGTLNLNGEQALGYARDRYIGNADFMRTERQRLVLEQVYNKLKNSSVIELNNLLNMILPRVQSNLSEGDWFSLILSIPSSRNYSIIKWSIPVENSYSFMTINKMSILKIDFSKNNSELYRKIYNLN